jgi:hypothetical protein
MKKIHLALLFLALIAFSFTTWSCNDSGPGDGLQRDGPSGRVRFMIGDSAKHYAGNIYYYDSATGVRVFIPDSTSDTKK